ncbi:lipid-A-disaccharide synthase [Idiomarina tyrosinivorans]|uniref:Lipid-A-disaccharide synthase n=1 Tax=Idiomarina tyrosinivorans TaxID=1445662 RepID=A0A432ZRS2_9GAMM|nr:lipid-A-disaccharide synthase [Idiomarina tyrosinivorans]RUO80573.1 lipid-A-disaccharide synthase [Idiomarina tyrosinivorans]
MSDRPPVIAIVAGEVSGDILGAGMMAALKQHYPQARFIGIGGDLMTQQGLVSSVDMDELSVMGLFEVLKRLPRLLAIRKQLLSDLIAAKPDLYVGIDAPDFNLPVEKRLKAQGIKTVHYVSPSVWAWREGRIKGIKKAVDHMLCLLPFEKDFYDAHGVPATFVGHPLADDIPLQWPALPARQALELSESKRWLAVLPGSRSGEVERLGPIFLEAIKQLYQRHEDLAVIAPMVNNQRAQQFHQQWQQTCPEVPLTIRVGESRKTMAAADFLLLTSGTVTLEAMLIKRPMVVAYRFSWLTYQVIKRLFKAPFFSLPNLLAKRPLVPELEQQQVNPERIVSELEKLMVNDNSALLASFKTLHQQLQRGASQTAATVAHDLLEYSKK